MPGCGLIEPIWTELGLLSALVHAYGVERIGDGRQVYLVLELVEESRQGASRSWLTPEMPLLVECPLSFGLQIIERKAG